MFSNYLVIAWRQLAKNRLYASINILGLVIGLAIYVFGSILVDYERSHDTMFANHERIYTVGSVFSPTADLGVSEAQGIYTAFQPLIVADVPEFEAVARTVIEEFLVSIDDNHYYEGVRFADPAFLDIFQFDYLEGDARALDDPAGVLLSESVARKFFGDGAVLGRVISLDHRVNLRVSAVVRNPPKNTHFDSSLIGGDAFSVVAPLAALKAANGYDLQGNFNNLSTGDLTYLLVPDGKDRTWVQAKIDAVYESHADEDLKEFIPGLKVRPLREVNTAIWDMVGMPMLDSLRLLALMVLIVAIVNYTNLASAQALGRAREVGLRKTMGASRLQLLGQFLTESLCIVAVSMVIALVVLEVLVPAFNTASGKVLVLDHVAVLPWLVATTVSVGLLAGAYPAWVITRTSPIEAIRDAGARGVRGSLFRSVLLGLQFAISVFMLAMVLIVYFQNQKMVESSNIYPKSQIITLQRLAVDDIQERLPTLRNELMQIAGVQNVAFSSDVPYQWNNSSFMVGPVAGDKARGFPMKNLLVDEHFLSTYDVPVLAGRDLSVEVARDRIEEDATSGNVIVNELALLKLGYTLNNAVGQVFHDFPDDRQARAYTIVGVMPDQNFQGFSNSIKPTMYMMRGGWDYASVRVAGAGLGATLEEIESVWETLIPDYPIQTEFLSATFQDSFEIFSSINKAIGGFAALALLLSGIGLFGLAAFMAQQRTREIGIRKVMGANVWQIVGLLVWQFSRPVLWSLLIGLPLAWFASAAYVDFFADRLQMIEVIIVGAGVLCMIFAWSIVGLHAARIAAANPIHALRYE